MAGDRYQLQIQEQKTPGARQRFYGVDKAVLPSGLEASAEASAKAGVTITGGIDKLAAALKKRADEQDVLAAEGAINQYAKWNLDYTNNPQTGTFNDPKYKFAGAEGLTGKYEADSKAKADEIAGTLKNPRVKQMFLKNALRASMPFYKATQEFEGGQFEAKKKADFDTGNETGLQQLLTFPQDPENIQLVMEGLEARFTLQYAGAPKETLDQAIKDGQSKYETARIAAIAQNDPVAAVSLAKDSKYLTPSGRVDLMGKLKPEAERVKMQAFADDMVTKYGTEAAGVEAAWEYIDKHYEGSERDARKQAYNARVSEANRLENMRDAEKAKRQREIFEACAADYFQNGNVPSSAELERALASNSISLSQYETLVRWQENAETRAGITKRLSRSVPGWRDMTLQQQEEAVMRGAGRTDDERAAVLTGIKAGLEDGSVSVAELTAAYNNMYITASELEDYKKYGAKMKDYGSTVRGSYKKKLDNEVSQILSKLEGLKAGESAMVKNAAKGVFFDLTADLDPKDPKYESKLQDAAAEALSEAVTMSGADLTKTEWFGWGNVVDTAFGRAAKESAARVSSPPGIRRPELRQDKIALRNFSEEVLGGNYPVTSGPDDTRDNGTRRHGKNDFSAPKGTPVSAPSFFTEATVKNIKRDQRDAKKGTGNSVTLSFTGPDGEACEMQFNHLDDVSADLKNGMTVSPGDFLGKVGNSGSVAAINGDGSHLDVGLKVNGKYVDISKWHTPGYNDKLNSIMGGGGAE